MNPENAAVAAGFSASYARAKAYRIERSAKVGIADAFERAGLTDKAIVEYAMAALFAKKPIAADVMIKQEDGKLIAVKNENDWIEYEDWANRHKFFNSIMEMTDRIKHKLEHSGKIEGQETKIIIIHPNGKPKDEAILTDGSQIRINTETETGLGLPDKRGG